MKLCHWWPQGWTLGGHTLSVFRRQKKKIACSFQSNKKRDTKKLIHNTERESENSNTRNSKEKKQ